MIIRKIAPSDNVPLARLIRSIMAEYNADPRTTISGDPSLDTMFQNFQEEGAVYFIVDSGRVAGGCGIRRLAGGDRETCELQRMFISKELRGLGIGNQLLKACIEEAINFGYRGIYLETLGEMKTAISLYRKFGFGEIPMRLGATGHTGCEVKMLLNIHR